jgi:hypothetical protein
MDSIFQSEATSLTSIDLYLSAMAELQTDQDPLEHLIAFVECLRPSMLLEELDTEKVSALSKIPDYKSKNCS